MPYMHIGKSVYKKNPDGTRGKKVGTTKGSVKKYLKALYSAEGRSGRGGGSSRGSMRYVSS